MSRKKKSHVKKIFSEMSLKDVERLARKALKNSGLTIKDNRIYSPEKVTDIKLQLEADKIFKEMARRPFE